MKNKIKAIVLLVLMVVSAAGIAFTVKDAATKEKLPGMNSAERTNQPIAENSLPQNEPPAIPDSAVPNENGGEKMLNGGDFKQTENRLTSVHIALIAVFSIVFSASLLYLLLSIRNRRFIKNREGNYICFKYCSVFKLSYGRNICRHEFFSEEQQRN